ncbi:YbhB/YbcL family Raf kinase inhibitor-like protein [Caulobacter sp. NIBR2454]|uniref:YbhB/YbcL family Raf kinase inhibitor-like protein n=1 Tax=Caulobacter sp. NIBR2454 TaxID=3015996 RepID=UPI0022B663EC|nr:YbhB/YbcL family Raf kinase inhibitor-like protein [Caulobacter sp. NIBR2454]
MLEKIPRFIGDLLRYARAGEMKIAYFLDPFDGAPETLKVSSGDFQDGARLLAPFTADGEGKSPSLTWSGAPDGTADVVLMVEDPDAPTPDPLVHAIAWNLPANGHLAADAISTDDVQTGKNAYMRSDYLPPDPPTGHGPHRYVFQFFALSEPLALTGTPGRKAVLKAMEGKVLAKGRLTGIYERA